MAVDERLQLNVLGHHGGETMIGKPDGKESIEVLRMSDLQLAANEALDSMDADSLATAVSLISSRKFKYVGLVKGDHGYIEITEEKDGDG